MRTIQLDLTGDENVSRYAFAGFEGEHNATCLKVLLPERMCTEGVEYRFLFENARGEAVFSAPVIPEEGVVSVWLTRALTLFPRLKAYVGCYRMEAGEPVLIEKSAEMILGIQKSVTDGDALDLGAGDLPGLVLEDAVLEESENPVKSSAIHRALEEKVGKADLSKSLPKKPLALHDRAVSETAVADALEGYWSKEELSVAEEIKREGQDPVQGSAIFLALEEKVGKSDLSKILPEKNAARADRAVSEQAVVGAMEHYVKKEDYQSDARIRTDLVANALKGSASGNAVALSDVSPLEHEIKVKLSGFSVEEVFKYDENLGPTEGFLYTDITESGVYVVESVTYDEDGDSTYITFEGGITAEINWLDGEPFAVGDVVFVKVEGETYSFSVLHGATVQKLGLNLFDYETFCALQGFKKQADGSWLGSSKFLICFAPTVKKKGSMCIRLEAKLAESVTGVPFYLQLKYTDGNPFSIFELRYPQSDWNVFEYITDPERTVEYIRWSYSGTEQTDAYYVKEMMISYADAPYEPYTGTNETYTADENGNVNGIVGNGESMTLIAEDGVTMEAEYNRDINKAFAELLSKIENTGGSV